MPVLLDMGCGRGRIAHYFATLTGGQVSGYDIDPNQIENAVDWAAECGMSDRLHFKVGDHHEPLVYESNTFDGCYSFQAVWPFFKKAELDAHAKEMHRVLKPGARYACSEYLLTPAIDTTRGWEAAPTWPSTDAAALLRPIAAERRPMRSRSRSRFRSNR